VGVRCSDYATPSIRKTWQSVTSPPIAGRSVGIVVVITGLNVRELFIFEVTCEQVTGHKVQRRRGSHIL
jgi:hypothetical protein